MKIEFLKKLAKGLAIHFGPKCEIAVHDLTDGPESTIVAIENGHVTGRNIGDGASRIVIQALLNPETAEDNIGYQMRTHDGRLLRSSSIYLKDEHGKPIALLSINYDFTELSHAVSLLNQFMGIHQKELSNNIDTIFPNVNDLLDRLIDESAAHVGKPVALMGKEDKVKAMKFLNEKGAFLIMKSGDKVAQFFDISKHTLYNYLQESEGE